MKIKNGSKEYEFVRSVRRGSPHCIDWLILKNVEGYGRGNLFAKPMNTAYVSSILAHSRDELSKEINKIANRMLECKCDISCDANKDYWEFMRQQSAYEKFKESFKEKKEIKNGKLRNNKKESK